MLPGIYRFYLSFQIIDFVLCWYFLLCIVFILFIYSYPTFWVYFALGITLFGSNLYLHMLSWVCVIILPSFYPFQNNFPGAPSGMLVLIRRINWEERNRDVRNCHVSAIGFNPITWFTSSSSILWLTRLSIAVCNSIISLYLLQDPLGPSPYSWCPEDLAMAPWENPLNCWLTVFKLKSQRLMSTSMR